MYTLSQLRRGVRNPKRILREFNRLYYTRFRTRNVNPDGVDFFEEDWDNLFILDACRYDTFADVAPEFDLPGRLKHRISKGAATPEFIWGNLDGADLSDTVYVTATTMLYRETVLRDRTEMQLHDVVDVWKDSIDYGEFGVLPETMAERIRETYERYPDKRIVAHFIQPHIPFIGPTGEDELGDVDGPIWSAKLRGDLDVPDEVLWRAYRENLEAVLPIVRDLMTELGGRTVVTADHGQFIGERGRPLPFKEYGHPTGIFSEELVKVPWLVHDNGERRKITTGPGSTGYGENEVDAVKGKAEEHLRQLGYVE